MCIVVDLIVRRIEYGLIQNQYNILIEFMESIVLNLK